MTAGVLSESQFFLGHRGPLKLLLSQGQRLHPTWQNRHHQKINSCPHTFELTR